MFNHDLDRNVPDMKFHGFYRGTVVDVQDPLKSGRVKVKVFSVYDQLGNDGIPWAEYADPMMTMGFFAPDVGDLLWVFFDNGDHMKPVYFAGAASGKFGHSEKTNGSYPNNRVFKVKGGHKIEVNNSGTGQINIQHNSGTRLTLNGDGSVDLNVVSDYRINVAGNMETTVTGNTTTNVGGSASTDVSGSITVGAGGGASLSASSISESASGAITMNGSTISMN
jgi:hypothetical protein